MEKKICTKCKLEKEISSFYFLKKENKHKTTCAECDKSYVKKYRDSNKSEIKNKNKEYASKHKDKYAEYSRKYRIKNLEKIQSFREKNKIKNNEAVKKYNSLNKEKVEEYKKMYREKNKEKAKIYRENNKEKAVEYRIKNRDRIKMLQKQSRIKNKDKINEKIKIKRDTNPLFKLDLNIRNLIKNSFKKTNHRKAKKTVQILGCTVKYFKAYIEERFESWMNWGNYGKYDPNGPKTWNIDHIIPIYVAKTEEDIIRLNHYTNLRPLCSKENLDKSNKLI
jgi:hypothetical protein